jgi:hypothetical protein
VANRCQHNRENNRFSPVAEFATPKAGGQMNLRQGAALALPLLAACGPGLSYRPPQSTGWQIMQPPQIEGRSEGTVDETAPLSKWVVAPWDIDVHPTQDQCEATLDGRRNGSRREGFPQYSNVDAVARCVSINDPALKGN